MAGNVLTHRVKVRLYSLNDEPRIKTTNENVTNFKLNRAKIITKTKVER